MHVEAVQWLLPRAPIDVKSACAAMATDGIRISPRSLRRLIAKYPDLLGNWAPKEKNKDRVSRLLRDIESRLTAVEDRVYADDTTIPTCEAA